MTIRFLINDNGSPFDSSELKALKSQLNTLSEDEREVYRNENARVIATHSATRILIVSGPGTGKTHLFGDRIDYWCQNDSQASVFVTSFVRKLVQDLQNDIHNDSKLSNEQKDKITVYTLHKFARSTVEKNRGTREWPFQPYFRIIGQSWKDVVWSDVLAFYPGIDESTYAWREFEDQLHNDRFEESRGWKELRETYFKLCEFYNAAGFADLILRARTALTENPSLSGDSYFIIDEHQDFNRAEDALITQLAGNPKGLLVVGDDDQVLYERLKSSKASLIRNLYKDNNYANAMLPFCGRSTCCITKVAHHFIQHNRDEDGIEKIYLPIKPDNQGAGVQLIACATPATAVDYIHKFIADHKPLIDQRREELVKGEETEPLLLVLTPAREVKFYGNSKEELRRIITQYQSESRSSSEDYYKAVSYYSLAGNPHNNFTFRKVLFYEGVSPNEVHNLIVIAMQKGKALCELRSDDIERVLTKCNNIKNVIDSDHSIDQRIKKISKYISISDEHQLKKDIERRGISHDQMCKIEHEEDEEAELEELEAKKMSAVELMTLVGAKGLSADHVVIIGFDDMNMRWVTKNAFYVAMTRARKSLHILTALQSGGATQTHSFLQHLPENHIEFYTYRKGDRILKRLPSRQQFIDYLDRTSACQRRSRSSKKSRASVSDCSL